MMTVADFAKIVATTYPEATDIEYLDNPRVEAEGHYYNVTHQGLVDLGLEAHLLSATLIDSMFEIAERHRHRTNRAALRPLVDWRQTSNPVRAT
jgi:UDP-sulfoquinovose synthase